MKFLKLKNADLLVDTFCSIMLGTAISTVFFTLLQYSVGFGECLLYVLTATILIVILSRKWWILPAFLAASVLLVTFVSLLLEATDDVLNVVEVFFSWCVSSNHTLAPDAVSDFIWHIMIVLPVCIITVLYFRRVFFFLLLPPIAVAVLVWVYFNLNNDIMYVLFTLLFVVFIAAAKARGNKISRSDSNGISSAMLSVSAVIIMPFILIFAFIIAPSNDVDWKCMPLVNSVQDIGDFFGLGEGRYTADGSFSMKQTGFSPLEQRLGGNAEVNNDIVLRVKTDTPIRLTGAVYDTYDGTKWYDSFPRERYRFNSILWQIKRSEVFNTDKPYDSNMNALYEKITKTINLNITCLMKGSTVFAAGQIQALDSESDISDVFFNNQSELFSQSPNNRLEYDLSTVVIDREADDFDENIKRLEELAAQTIDAEWDEINKEYLQLPESLPQSVFDSAYEITKECSTPYEKAKAIEQWLSNNCVYTLTPGQPDDGDFVSNFLQNKEGYCVYYASAMTVMARCVGLPARYVIGFGLKRNPITDADNSYVATNATAHAWVEVYFKGIGWVTFDATSWNFDEDAVVSQSQLQSSPYMPQPTSTVTPSMDLSSNNVTEDTGGWRKMQQVILITLLCLLIVFGLFILIRYLTLFSDSQSYYKRLCRKYARIADRLDACYSKLIRQIEFLGIIRQPADTISILAGRVDDLLGNRGMSDVCGIVVDVRFGEKNPSDQDVIRLCSFSAQIEKCIRIKLGLRGYLWHRILRRRVKKYRRSPV